MSHLKIVVVVGSLVLVCGLSCAHFFSLRAVNSISVFSFGVVGWGSFCVLLIVFANKNKFFAFVVFFSFFFVGYAFGPFLEPPADTFDHLYRTKILCGEPSRKVAVQNSGLWHYGMNSVVLCALSDSYSNPELAIQRIKITNALYYGLLSVTLFILARSAGLPCTWSLFSVLCCFLFMGTDKFSYFSYYSLGPTCTSIAVYWFWIAVFFFRRSKKEVVVGILTGILLLPVLWVNHYQEAAFLGFILLIYFLMNCWLWICERDSSHKKLVQNIFVFTVFSGLFLLPQFSIVRNMIVNIFPGNYWLYVAENSVVKLQGIQIIARFWSAFRVNGTLGLIGYLPVLIAIVHILFFRKDKSLQNSGRIIVLGLIPFIVFCTPLFHMLWGESVKWAVYYRLCYSSLFWLPIALFLFALEKRIIIYTNDFEKKVSEKIVRNVFFVSCLCIFVAFSSIRSKPVYGKLDFITINSTAWREEWQLLIKNLAGMTQTPLVTDYITAAILYDIFGYPVDETIMKKCNYLPYNPLDVQDMIKSTVDNRRVCLVNLKGFPPTWVPAETQHWPREYADTSKFYHISGKGGKAVTTFLETKQGRKCLVFEGENLNFENP